MPPRNELPSASPRPDAGKVGNAARGVPEQSETRTTSSSGSTTANPPSRRMPEKKAAVSGAHSKGLAPTTRAGPEAKRPPAFPSIRPPTSRSSSSNSVHEQSHKRNHEDAFPSSSNRDRGQQPVRYNRDRSKGDENPGQPESRHNSARFEVISISSDNDEDPDSDDEPLVAARQRKATSGTPNPSAHQRKKQTPSNIPSRPSSTAPDARIRSNTSQRSHAELRPSTAQEGPRTSHVSRASSEYRADTGISEVSQSNQGSKRLRTDVPLTYDCFLRNIGSISSPSISGVAEGPKKAHASADDLGKDRVSATTMWLENEKQELKAKLEQQATENQALAKQLRESRALSKGTNQSKLAKERELSTLREELGARDEQIKLLMSEKVSLSETITQLRDEASQEKEDANQSLIARQNQVDDLQKLLDDQVTHGLNLEVTVMGLRRNQESNRYTAAEITKLQAANRELREKNTQLEGENSQMEGVITDVRDQSSQMEEEKSQMMAQNGRLQTRLEELKHQLQQQSAEKLLAEDATKTQIEEIQGQVSSQRDEIREYERRIANLHEEVDWYEGNRERMKKEWDERMAMEMKWRDDLLAINNNPSIKRSNKMNREMRLSNNLLSNNLLSNKLLSNVLRSSIMLSIILLSDILLNDSLLSDSLPKDELMSRTRLGQSRAALVVAEPPVESETLVAPKISILCDGRNGGDSEWEDGLLVKKGQELDGRVNDNA
ncbi:hypothetical protein INS49_014253 [Diaporthe citri]|uniref:uncharacterized protein n=1 Tax=Diaporthe citri TaxID=83186 RepID=UPI001C819C7E|nr:uncharacterized protein INS49_014253 [Diaporthe citri]KAG6358369.1 hypothetical protein INS49_014253 [Diaporthe citri]